MTNLLQTDQNANVMDFGNSHHGQLGHTAIVHWGTKGEGANAKVTENKIYMIGPWGAHSRPLSLSLPLQIAIHNIHGLSRRERALPIATYVFLHSFEFD